MVTCWGWVWAGQVCLSCNVPPYYWSFGRINGEELHFCPQGRWWCVCKHQTLDRMDRLQGPKASVSRKHSMENGADEKSNSQKPWKRVAVRLLPTIHVWVCVHIISKDVRECFVSQANIKSFRVLNNEDVMMGVLSYLCQVEPMDLPGLKLLPHNNNNLSSSAIIGEVNDGKTMHCLWESVHGKPCDINDSVDCG